MSENQKLEEIERLLKELKAAKAETSVTVDEVKEEKTGFSSVGKVFFTLWRRRVLLIALLLVMIFVAIPFATIYFLKSGSTFTEEKGVFLERIQDLNELATAEAYTKVIIEQQDNTIFGQSIGLNVPGTKRQLLVVIPGSVKAGVELSGLTVKDFLIDEEKRTAQLTLPPAKFLGGAELFFDQVEVYSYEGVFREKANIEEAYELADKAKQLIIEETTAQGVLLTAERNAVKTLQEMFSFTGYEVTINFEEEHEADE